LGGLLSIGGAGAGLVWDSPKNPLTSPTTPSPTTPSPTTPVKPIDPNVTPNKPTPKPSPDQAAPAAPAVTPTGQPREQPMTTEKDRATGNVPWGTYSGGEYIPNPATSSVPMMDSRIYDEQYQNGSYALTSRRPAEMVVNKKAQQQTEWINKRGMRTAEQADRDTAAQLRDPNSPMSLLIQRHKRKLDQQAEDLRIRQMSPEAVTKEHLDTFYGDGPYGFANGGYVSKDSGKPVDAGRDNRMIAVQDGEFVVNREAVRLMGLKNLYQLNRMAAGPDANKPIPLNGANGYANGGLVEEGQESDPYRSEYDIWDTAFKEDPVKTTGFSVMDFYGLKDDAGRMIDASSKLGPNIAKKGLYEGAKQTLKTSDISGLAKEAAQMGTKVPNPAKAGLAKTMGAIGTKAGGAVSRLNTLSRFYDMVAAPVAELTGHDYTTQNAINNLAFGEEGEEWNNYTMTRPERSIKNTRGRAIAGSDNPEDLKWYHKVAGAAESFANAATMDGYDAVRGTFDPNYGYSRGVNTDPYATRYLGEKFGDWAFFGNSDSEEAAFEARRQALIERANANRAAMGTSLKKQIRQDKRERDRFEAERMMRNQQEPEV
jgi:hypothetical protein